MKIQENNFLDWWKENKQNYSVVLLDIDGTLLIGNKALLNAFHFIRSLAEEKFLFVLLTNDAIHTTGEKEILLKAAGIEVLSNQIISCGDAISYLTEGLKEQLFLNMGMLGNPNYAESHGLKLPEISKTCRFAKEL